MREITEKMIEAGFQAALRHDLDQPMHASIREMVRSVFIAMGGLGEGGDAMKRLALDGMFWSTAHDNVGVYPQTVVGGPNAYDKPSERMEGWNAAHKAMLDNYVALSQWHANLPEAYRELVTELLLDQRVELRVNGKECKLFVNCSDTFYWACAAHEEITFEELDALKECWSLSEFSGGDLWCARKRGMRPMAACYRNVYSESDWPLFDACGPERDDPDGRGARE